MADLGVRIEYGDVAVGAKENFIASTDDNASFVNLSFFNKYNNVIQNSSNPCELYSTVLDGNSGLFPSDILEKQRLGFWSDTISDDMGNFSNPIEITFVANEKYISSGITLCFNKKDNIYCNNLNIKWYNDDLLIADENFQPDNYLYSCVNHVEYYNKVVITFYSINMPKNRLKIEAIDYGFGTIFKGNEVKSVKVIQELDPLSSSISINTADIIISSKTGTKYSFQEKQPITIYYDGKLIAKHFIESVNRQTETQWTIRSEDYIGILASTPFEKHFYENEKVINIVNDIFTRANVPFQMDSKFNDETISGYIEDTNCRDVLLQVAFTIQAVVDTSNIDYVNIFSLNDAVKQYIPRERIIIDQRTNEIGVLTAVHFKYPTYVVDESYRGDINQYGSVDTFYYKYLYGIGTERIEFEKPVARVEPKDKNDVQIVSFNPMWVIVNKKTQNSSIKVYPAVKREITKVIQNSDITQYTNEKIATIHGSEFLSVDNLDKIVDACYNYYRKHTEITMKIAEGKHLSYGEAVKYGASKYGEVKYGEREKTVVYDEPVNVGDVIKFDTEYIGTYEGRIEKIAFDLKGGIIVKEVVVR